MNRANRCEDALMVVQESRRLKQQQTTKAVDSCVVKPITDPDMKVLAVYNVVIFAGDDDADFVESEMASCLCGAAEVNIDIAMRNWRLIAYALIMTCGIVTQAGVIVLCTRRQFLYVCIAIAVVFVGGTFLSLPFGIAKAAVSIYFNSLLYLQIPGALSDFYPATPSCLLDGPHFSYTFHQTVGAPITNAGGVTVAILFTRFFSSRRYAFDFIVTTVLQVFVSIFDLIIVKRWNVRIGIPDHAIFIPGNAIVYEICFAMPLMPAQILISRLCPCGTETIDFALLVGFHSAGVSISIAVVSILIENF